MKVMMTLGILLSVLSSTAGAEIPLIRLEPALPSPEQRAANIEICTQNLILIGKSIRAYHKETGDFPLWLSDLYHPKYLPDPDILICPSDRRGGKSLFTRNIDPKAPTSYGYQFHPEYRERKPVERLQFGDVVPLVRCRHHANQEFQCLNLNFSFEITRSTSLWEANPEQLYENTETAIAAIEAGLQRQPYQARLSRYVYPALARLYVGADRAEDVDGLITRFKSVMDPDYYKNWTALAKMLEMRDRTQEVLEVFKELEARNPGDLEVSMKIADLHEKLGNTELAMEYRRKSSPTPVLVGKPMPDFSATDLEGTPISLKQYRGKVVLLDFWAVWCGPCIAEMPNLKRVYNAYKEEGFDIIGISLDTDESKFREYLKENEIPWRQVFSGKGWKSPLAQQYAVRAIPAPWLIGRDGTLISNQARGEALEKLVAAALKK